MKYVSFLLFLLLILSACEKYTPKPSGYFRIDLPKHDYKKSNDFDYFNFLISKQAVIQKSLHGNKNEFNIIYPQFNAEIFCSYIPTNKENIPQLSEESRKFVYLHIQKADAIQEMVYENKEHNVFGLIYNIKGNVASPIQFSLTDSLHSFFRGALYFNHKPNQDSIAPVLEYVNKDIQTLIESFQWKQKKK